MEATVTVTATADVGPNTVAITFDTPEGFSAEPGQFVKLSADVEGEGYARFYTLSSPNTDGTFEVTIGFDPEAGGPFSEHIAGLKTGDEIEMSGPYGSDHYEGEARVVILAGGPGVGPAVGIAERAIEDGNDAAVVYRDGVFAHEARLDALADQGVAVHYVKESGASANAEPAEGADADMDNASAEFTAAIADVVTGEPGEQVFVFGFMDFVTAAQHALDDIEEVSVEEAKVENFG